MQQSKLHCMQIHCNDLDYGSVTLMDLVLQGWCWSFIRSCWLKHTAVNKVFGKSLRISCWEFIGIHLVIALVVADI